MDCGFRNEIYSLPMKLNPTKYLENFECSFHLMSPVNPDPKPHILNFSNSHFQKNLVGSREGNCGLGKKDTKQVFRATGNPWCLPIASRLMPGIYPSFVQGFDHHQNKVVLDAYFQNTLFSCI